MPPLSLPHLQLPLAVFKRIQNVKIFVGRPQTLTRLKHFVWTDQNNGETIFGSMEISSETTKLRQAKVNSSFFFY